MAGTSDQIFAENRNENNNGDSIVTPLQRNECEARLFAYIQAGPIGAPNHQRSNARFLVQLLYFAANVGTGNSGYWKGKSIKWTDHAGAAHQVAADAIAERITADPDGTGAAAGFPATMRAYFRIRAPDMLRLAKSNPSWLIRASKMGLPDAFRHLAFDFIDVNVGLSADEQNAVDAAKQLSLYRSQRRIITNTAVQYQGAATSTAGGSVQTNARQITFS